MLIALIVDVITVVSVYILIYLFEFQSLLRNKYSKLLNVSSLPATRGQQNGDYGRQ